MRADLVLTNGKIFTMNPSQPHAEAVAIKDGKIVQVGTNDDVNRWIGKDAKIIDLKGKTVVPGFIDTHIHVADFGTVLAWLDLSNVRSIQELQAALKARVQRTPRGKWVIGRGWDQNRFAEMRLPTRHDLDAFSADTPVILYHECGQICIVNSKALELAGLTKQTVVTGGDIDKNAETGDPTGVLRDAATSLVWKFVPMMTEDELVEAVSLAFEKIVKAGVTSVCWIVLSSMELPVIKKLHVQNRLPLRVYVVVPVDLLDSVLASTLPKQSADNALRIGGVMIFADGYLAARTAALFQSYKDCPDSSGKLLYTQEEMNALAVKICKANLQLVIHAVGDKAVDAALNTVEGTLKEACGKELRNRIEQAAVLNEELLQRMKNHKVIVSVQPCVVDSEFRVWSAAERLGPERVQWLYPIRKLISEGVKVSGGSDCPMEPLSPLLGIKAAVTREFFSEECVTVEDALRLYTIDAAYAIFEENIKGSIEKGKLADLTILSRDPWMVEPKEIGDIKVEMTIVGGRVVHT
ncbi:amidohydrolase [Candidatus Bathyarchaeota archaeon]|nr:amidohydrolase [Candidatus Bathyarchaeota archaeon]